MIYALPEPLSAEEQEELCRKLPEDKEVKKLLAYRNMRLVVHIAKRFADTGEIEDLVSIGAIGLIKAIDKFDCEKNVKLATFAARCIENEILMYLRKERKQQRETSLETPLITDNDGNSLKVEDILEDESSTKTMRTYEDIEMILKILNSISNALYQKSTQELIIFMYMIAGKKQRKVAESCDLSQSYISRLFKKYRKLCREVDDGCYESENHFIYFCKDGEDLCVKIQGYPAIKTTFEQESFEKIADFLAFLLM